MTLLMLLRPRSDVSSSSTNPTLSFDPSNPGVNKAFDPKTPTALMFDPSGPRPA